MDRKLLDLLACPICKGKLTYQKRDKRLVCRYNKVAYPIKNDIPVLLEREAVKLRDEDMPR